MLELGMAREMGFNTSGETSKHKCIVESWNLQCDLGLVSTHNCGEKLEW